MSSDNTITEARQRTISEGARKFFEEEELFKRQVAANKTRTEAHNNTNIAVFSLKGKNPDMAVGVQLQPFEVKILEKVEGIQIDTLLNLSWDDRDCWFGDFECQRVMNIFDVEAYSFLLCFPEHGVYKPYIEMESYMTPVHYKAWCHLWSGSPRNLSTRKFRKVAIEYMTKLIKYRNWPMSPLPRLSTQKQPHEDHAEPYSALKSPNLRSASSPPPNTPMEVIPPYQSFNCYIYPSELNERPISFPCAHACKHHDTKGGNATYPNPNPCKHSCYEHPCAHVCDFHTARGVSADFEKCEHLCFEHPLRPRSEGWGRNFRPKKGSLPRFDGSGPPSGFVEPEPLVTVLTKGRGEAVASVSLGMTGSANEVRVAERLRSFSSPLRGRHSTNFKKRVRFVGVDEDLRDIVLVRCPDTPVLRGGDGLGVNGEEDRAKRSGLSSVEWWRH